MNRDALQRLRDLPIEEVAGRLGFEVRRHKALCPFHDDSHPSLSFNLRNNTYRCFVCGEHGGTIDLVMRCLHKDFKEACTWLGGDNEVIRCVTKTDTRTKTVARPFDASRYEPYFRQPWLGERARRFLFEERRLDPRVVRWCRLSSWNCWLQIPYFDIDGRLTGVQWRNLGIEGPRFRFPQGSRCSIYNLPVLNRLKPGDDLYIAEGCSDCWSLLSAGHKAIAIPSATLLKPHDLDVLFPSSSSLSLKFHMYPDNDEPGERLFLQLRDRLPGLQRHPLPPGCKDFSDLWRKETERTP